MSLNYHIVYFGRDFYITVGDMPVKYGDVSIVTVIASSEDSVFDPLDSNFRVTITKGLNQYKEISKGDFPLYISSMKWISSKFMNIMKGKI